VNHILKTEICVEHISHFWIRTVSVKCCSFTYQKLSRTEGKLACVKRDALKMWARVKIKLCV